MIVNQRDINRRQKTFVQKGINERLTPPKIIQMGGGSRGGGTAAIIAEVIEQCSYTIDGVPGRAYYTLRLKSDGTAGYVAETEYALNAECISAVDGFKYISIANENTGHEPSASPTWWSVSEEIRVTKIWGAQNLGQLVSDAVPWIEVGEDVELYYDSVEDEYYIKSPSLMYAGEQDEATLRYNPDLKVVQAVFR
jgi:hypothetical protein